MSIDLYKNDTIYTRIAEGEVAMLLAEYSSDYIMNCVITHLSQRLTSYIPLPNIVSSFEENFKLLKQNYPSDVENIEQTRFETYSNIIDIICNEYNLEYIGDNITTIDSLYSVAYYMYDAFICNYKYYVITFFKNFIKNNKNDIYNALSEEVRFKNKKSNDILIKLFDGDIELITMLSAMSNVLYYISGFDIDFNMFLTSCGMDSHEVKVILSHVIPKSNIYKEKICDVMNYPDLITEIKLSIQSEIIENNKSKIDEITSQYIISNNDNVNKEEL